MSMMLGRAIQVLLVLQGLQSSATQCDDQVAYVQKDLKALKSDALEVTGRTCTGITSGNGFKLTHASQACNNISAQNLKQVCCSQDRTCGFSNFQLTGDHSCGGDVCCRGSTTCGDSTFSGVRHMVCLGGRAFVCLKATVSLAGDMVFGGGDFAGLDGKFNFTTEGDHCVRQVGGPSTPSFAMQRATFTFEQTSNARIICNTGNFPCLRAKVVLSEGSCLHITCTTTGACRDLQVLPLVEGNTNFQCYCSGSQCDWTNSYSYCNKTTENPCGANICPGTAPGCLKVGQETTADPLDCDAVQNAPSCDGDVTGDPHLRTLDGRHYTLLQKGNFLLWGFSGYETEVPVNGAVKKVPLDFEVFTHYAGHAAFTKGLLLVDRSQKPSQALEMTTTDCLWHHWDTSTWRPVELGLLNMTDPEGVHFGTFKLTKSKGGQKKLELLIHEGAGPRTLAQLWISCRPGHQLSAKIKMSSQKDLRFVRGELAPGRLSLATGLQSRGTEMATDAEFAVTSDWAALGGSSAAASYFKMFDTKGSHLASRECTNEDKDEYAKTCRKHLGDSRDALYKEVLDDCIFDLCNGGGETSAELAAEIYHAE